MEICTKSQMKNAGKIEKKLRQWYEKWIMTVNYT